MEMNEHGSVPKITSFARKQVVRQVWLAGQFAVSRGAKHAAKKQCALNTIV